MKYFTLDWWRGNYDEDADDPFDLYRPHFETIRVALPPDFTTIFERTSLHDAKVRKMDLNVVDAALAIDLDGDNGSGGLRRFHLLYSGVRSFLSLADPTSGLSGPFGYGDYGYHEAYILEPGVFEHRILFSSGIELRIVFSGFLLR